MSTRSSVAVILICGFTALLLAQAPAAPPKPGPEHKKLEYFVGKWTVESEIKANEFVPAGKTVGTETNTLGPGGFYVESRAEGQLGTRFGFIAYDSHAKVYTSYYASSVGLVGTGIGSVNGNTWTWMVEDKYAGQSVKGRTTITMLSPTQYTSKYEMADGKGGYTTLVEGKAKRNPLETQAPEVRNEAEHGPNGRVLLGGGYGVLVLQEALVDGRELSAVTLDGLRWTRNNRIIRVNFPRFAAAEMVDFVIGRANRQALK